MRLGNIQGGIHTTVTQTILVMCQDIHKLVSVIYNDVLNYWVYLKYNSQRTFNDISFTFLVFGASQYNEINNDFLLDYILYQMNENGKFANFLYANIINLFVLDERHFLSGYDSALFYGAYAYQYDREASGRQYRYTSHTFSYEFENIIIKSGNY